jgi:hypothetical protein
MTKKNLRRIGAMAALVALALSFSSCNRGYGCPNNFSLSDVLTTVLAALPK